MTDHAELCARLRALYVASGTDYVQRAADVIERLQHTVEAMSADLDQNRVTFETLTAERSALIERISQMREDCEAVRRAALEQAAMSCEMAAAEWVNKYPETVAYDAGYTTGLYTAANTIRNMIERAEP